MAPAESIPPHCRPDADTIELPRGALFDQEEPDPIVYALARDLVALSDQLQEVAGILGACTRCFGIQPNCAGCGGKGSPGWRESTEPALLEYWLRNLGRPRNRTRSA